MKFGQHLLVAAVLWSISFGVTAATAAPAAKAPVAKVATREQLQTLTAQLQQTPNDKALRESVMKLAQSMKPAPTVPVEAVKFEGRAQYAFKMAKSPAEFLDAAREYMKAADLAPWVPGYYYDLCTILDKAGRQAEAINACNFYLAAAPDAADAGDVQKLVAGLDYAAERARENYTRRHDCATMEDIYGSGDKVAWLGSVKISMKLISSLYGGVWQNQILLQEITTFPQVGVGQRFHLTPIDKTFQLDDRSPGLPYYRLTIGGDGRITFGAYASTQAEIVTSIDELTKLRNTEMNNCLIATREGKYFVLLAQGGSLSPNDGAKVNGGLAFESDCSGNLLGERPGWFPVSFTPHQDTPGVTADQASWIAQGFSVASASSCQSTTSDLGWLSP